MGTSVCEPLSEERALPIARGDISSIRVDLPERCDGVRLSGAMRDVGFRDRQWLAERDGRFIQISEVLYRILEHADGGRTLADVARCVTDTTEWLVDEEIVRNLIETKLRPLGLIRFAGDEIGLAERPRTSSSLLGVNLRTKMLPPRIVDPLTERLQWLFSAPAMAALFAAIAAAHWWLYRVPDLGRSFYDVLYTPGALLAVFGIVIGAGLIHELGHASALRYGGGRARGIGAGWYLVFPAFYTDATDSYRLGRAARVRTDLGGIYFHLIGALGLIVAAAWSHSSVLLVAAILIDLEALRQFIPFVQLDGYWLLADITGIPDFFSQMGPFLRSILPWHTRGSKLPPLRAAAKSAFAIYTLAVLPVLCYLLIVMLMHLPGLLSATREAIEAQIHLLSSSAPLLTWMLALTQMLFLALPLVGSVCVLGWTVASVTRPFVSPTPRRLVGALCVAVGAASVLVWTTSDPGMAATVQDGGMPDAAKLIQDARRVMERSNVLEAEVRGRLGADRFTGKLTLKRPNLALVEVSGSEGLGTFLVDSNGRDLFVYFPEDRQFTRTAVRGDGKNINAFLVDQVRYFFDPDSLGAVPKGGRVEFIGERTIDSIVGDVVEVVGPSPTQPVFYFISRRDHFVRRVTHGSAFDDASANWVEVLNVRADAQVEAARFQRTIPSDAAPLQVPFTLPLLGIAGTPDPGR
jgi:putative peptide zinc metalloprotease protein